MVSIVVVLLLLGLGAVLSGLFDRPQPAVVVATIPVRNRRYRRRR